MFPFVSKKRPGYSVKGIPSHAMTIVLNLIGVDF